MPHLIVYLLKANAALCIFYLAYRFLLRRLTFYYLNRFFLVFGIIFSATYPFIDLSALFVKHQVLSRQLVVIVPNWQAIAPAAIPQPSTFFYWQIPVILFWMGVVLMAIRLAIQFISLYKIHKSSSAADYKGQPFRRVKNDISPFSFWQAIYLNPDKHENQELQAIIEHEKIHIAQWHTLDVLLVELSAVFYWFNPGVWFMKQAIKENLEFITDRKILQGGIDEKSYQYSLLSVSNLKQSSAMVNNFNFSTIRKRILMMNKKRSSKVQVSRYVVLLPLVVILTLVFTISKAELTPKSISAFVKRILPKTMVSNADQHPVLPVIDTQNKVFSSVDTGRKLKKADTASVKSDQTGVATNVSESDVADAKDHLTTLYNEHKPISSSDILSYVLKATNIKQPPAGDHVDMKTALYVFVNGKNLIYADSRAKVLGISPSKIDSVTILKSSDAIALYGHIAKYGAVVMKLKPGVVGDSWQVTDVSEETTSDKKPYFGGDVTKTISTSPFGNYSPPTAAFYPAGDKMNQAPVTATVIYPPTNDGAGADINNNQEINYALIPDGIEKSDFKEVIKLFKDNGFALNINKEYKDNAVDMLKISLTSKDKTAMSATYRVRELMDSHYYINIRVNKVTNQLNSQSVKGN